MKMRFEAVHAWEEENMLVFPQATVPPLDLQINMQDEHE